MPSEAHFEEFFNIIWEFTQYQIDHEEYQTRMKEVVPREIYGLVNCLIYDLVQSVELQYLLDLQIPRQAVLQQIESRGPEVLKQDAKVEGYSNSSSPTSPPNDSMDDMEYLDEEDDDFELKPKKQQNKMKTKNKTKSRIRNEWTLQEERIFLDCIKAHGTNFTKIAQILTSRTRYQIRTHYAYLAKSITANDHVQDMGEAPARRIKARGRPPKGDLSAYMPSEMLVDLTKCIRHLEELHPRRGRNKE